jgi:hypothetical protein
MLFVDRSLYLTQEIPVPGSEDEEDEDYWLKSERRGWRRVE